MSSSISEKSEIPNLQSGHQVISSTLTIDTWGILHRAGLDNIHIEMCHHLVHYLLTLSKKVLNRDRIRIKIQLEKTGLPQNPLDKVMGVLFP